MAGEICLILSNDHSFKYNDRFDESATTSVSREKRGRIVEPESSLNFTGKFSRISYGVWRCGKTAESPKFTPCIFLG